MWRETYFSEGGWKASLGSLLPWKAQQSVRYGKFDLDLRTAISLVLTPDGRHLWTICLDHTINVWDIAQGRQIIRLDLDGDTTRDFEKPGTHVVDPGHTNLIRIVPMTSGHSYIIATFSPNIHRFKFWKFENDQINEHWESFSFEPPFEDLVHMAVWTLESFHIRRIPGKSQHYNLWTLIRSGTRTYTFNLSFEIDKSFKKLDKIWKSKWIQVADSNNVSDAQKHELDDPSDLQLVSPQGDPVNITERWLKYIFYPGRFTETTLETALEVYQKSLSSNRSRPSIGRPLPARLCETVGTSLHVEASANNADAYTVYQDNIAVEWQKIHNVIKDLHKRREHVLSLAYDELNEHPWIVHADQISVVRRYSLSENVWYNRLTFAISNEIDHPMLFEALDEAEDLKASQLLHALSIFRACLPKAFLLPFSSKFQAQIFSDTHNHALAAMKSLYDESGFATKVSDEDYNQLTDALDPLDGFQGLETKTFLHALNLLGQDQEGIVEEKMTTRYGARFLIKGAQDTLRYGSEIILDMLLFIVFLNYEIEPADLPEDLDPADIYTQLVEHAREFHLLNWLAGTPIQEGRAVQPDTESLALGPNKSSPSTTVTLMEDFFIGDWASLHVPKQLHFEQRLTYWCQAWTFGAKIRDRYEELTPNIASKLLQNGDLDQALIALKYLSSAKPWDCYVRARIHLARADFADAAHNFDLASSQLCKYFCHFLFEAYLSDRAIATNGFNAQQHGAAQLLDLEERDHLGDGPARYNRHVMALFEKVGAMSYVGEYAQKALDDIVAGDMQAQDLHSELLSRHFTAMMQTSRFAKAFETLIRYSDLAIRRAGLNKLLDALLTHSRPSFLLSLPVPADLATEITERLIQLSSPPCSTVTELTRSLVPVGFAPYKALYAWSIARHDFRVAAACLWERVQRLRAAQRCGMRGAEIDDQLAEAYVGCVNCLSLVEPEMAWILMRPLEVVSAETKGRKRAAELQTVSVKRRIVTLDDVRREWQAELDRVADVQAGRFPFLPEDEDSDEMNLHGNVDAALSEKETTHDVFA